MRASMMVGIVLSGLVVAAQEATVALPDTYRVQFENAWVRVTRVTYGPRQVLPAHTHTPLASAYVYLNDGPPVRYTHVGGHNTVATRPATKAGSFRVFRGIDEVHSVENLGDAPSEFLRVEFKTEPRATTTFTGRFAPPAGADGVTRAQVELDHPLARITRMTLAADDVLTLDTSGGEPSLLVALSPAALAWGPAASVPALVLETGAVQWLGTRRVGTLRNMGRGSAHLLEFEFRSPPLSR